METGEGKVYQNKRAATSPRHDLELLPGSERLATLLDGAGKRPAARRTLLALFPPFLEHLVASGLSSQTIQKHVDNVWALGGEFIRDLHNDPSLRKMPVDVALRQIIEYGGPLLYGGGDEDQRSFDAVGSCTVSSRRPLSDAHGTDKVSPDEAFFK